MVLVLLLSAVLRSDNVRGFCAQLFDFGERYRNVVVAASLFGQIDEFQNMSLLRLSDLVPTEFERFIIRNQIGQAVGAQQIAIVRRKIHDLSNVHDHLGGHAQCTRDPMRVRVIDGVFRRHDASQYRSLTNEWSLVNRSILPGSTVRAGVSHVRDDDRAPPKQQCYASASRSKLVVLGRCQRVHGAACGFDDPRRKRADAPSAGAVSIRL